MARTEQSDGIGPKPLTVSHERAEPSDRRVARTRRLLREALIELLAEQRWEKITVQGIIDRADVGRSTFYAHFDSKLDLLISEVPNVVNTIGEPGPARFRPLVEHAASAAPVLRTLFGQDVEAEVTLAFQRSSEERWLPEVQARGLEPDDLIAAFVAGGVLASLRHWLVHRPEIDSDQVIEHLGQAVDAILEIAPAT